VQLQRGTAILAPRRSPSSMPDHVIVEWDEPQRRIAPGQSAVFYDGDHRARRRHRQR
jgi:tRNA U34 2-thiouridine synthase MnmA/TrmU